MLVVPAIIPKTKEQMEEEIKRVSSFAHLIQIDISDGIFTPVKTWPYNGRDTDYFEKMKTEEEGWPMWQSIDYEVHLMVKNPESVVLDWIHSGASAIIVHVEATDNIQNIIDVCKENSVSVGLAFKPSTDVERVKKFIDSVDFVQVMGSDFLGKHGTELDSKAIEKINTLQALYPERIIAIDIGVNEDTEGILINAGADKLISGSAILDAENPEEVFRELSS